jgi:hypothetical protein
MINSELLHADSSVPDIVSLFTPRANGMFLWVKLLTEYLKLPSLTLRDRLDAIHNLNLLEDLNSLYDAILLSLENQFPGQASVSVCRLFQWVSHSKRPLSVNEIWHAVSVPYDRAQTREDRLPTFQRSLGALSGSLIELTRTNVVQFIHFSTQEYFTGAGRLTTQTGSSKGCLVPLDCRS